MGYKKLSNGEWEQPAQAESRVIRRKIAGIVLSGAALIGSVSGAIYGIVETASSNVGQPTEQTDHDKLLGGLLITLFGAVATAGSALALGAVVDKNNNSLGRIRRDIQDGAKVVHGEVVIPHNILPADAQTQVRQPV